MNCPFCNFPVPPSPAVQSSPFDYAAACGTCKAVFTVRITVVSEPNQEWTENKTRRTNNIKPATGYCARCTISSPLVELLANGGFCTTCAKIVATGLHNSVAELIETLNGHATKP